MAYRLQTFLCWSLLLMAGPLAGEDAAPTLLKHFPAGGVAAAEVTDLGLWMEKIQSSEDYQDWLVSPLYHAWASTPDAKGFLQVNDFIRMNLGAGVDGLVQELFGHRAALCVYPPTNQTQPDAVLLIEAKNAEAVAELKKKALIVIGFSGEGMKPSDRADGYWQFTYPPNNTAVFADKWILSSNNPSLLELTIASLREPAATSLLDDENLQQMIRRQGTKHLLHAWANVEWLKEQHGKRFFPEKLPNPVASLLLAGLLETAEQATSIGLTAGVADDGIKLTLTTASKVADLPPTHRSFFQANPAAGKLEIPQPQGLLAGLVLYRDLNAWNRQRSELVDAGGLGGMNQFETMFRGFMQGKDFSKEVLPLLGQRWSLVFAPQSYAHLPGKPGERQPAAAIIVDLADPEAGGKTMQQLVQTVVTLANLQAPQQQREPWIMRESSHREIPLLEATYDNLAAQDELPTAYNVTPAAARVGNRYVLATAPDLCRSVIDALLDGKTVPAGSAAATDNLLIEVSPAMVAAALRNNQTHLIRNAARGGKTKGQAERELTWLVQLLEKAPPVRFRTAHTEDSLRFELECRTP